MIEPPPSHDQEGALARLAVELHAAHDVDETVQAVVDFALQALAATPPVSR